MHWELGLPFGVLRTRREALRVTGGQIAVGSSGAPDDSEVRMEARGTKRKEDLGCVGSGAAELDAARERPGVPVADVADAAAG